MDDGTSRLARGAGRRILVGVRRRSSVWRIEPAHTSSRPGFGGGSNAGTSTVCNGDARGDCSVNLSPRTDRPADSYRDTHTISHSRTDIAAPYRYAHAAARSHLHAKATSYANSRPRTHPPPARPRTVEDYVVWKIGDGVSRAAETGAQSTIQDIHEVAISNGLPRIDRPITIFLYHNLDDLAAEFETATGRGYEN